MQRIQAHEGDRSLAIWIREDALVTIDRIRVDFGNDERHIRIHTEGRAVIHHDATALHRYFCEFQRLIAAGAENRDIEAVEALWSGFFDGPALVAIGLSLPC